MMNYFKGLFGNYYFTDDKGKKLYYRSVNSTAYLVKPEQEKQLFLYRSRISVTIFVLAFLATFQMQWYIIALAGVAVYCYLEYRFHFVFLRKLTQYQNYQYTKKSVEVNSPEKEKNDKIVTFLYLALAIIMIIYAFLAKKTEIYIVGAFVIGYAIYRVYLAWYKKT